MNDEILIRGAREHNLKNITLAIPRNRFVVITGLSGSGKSTLAFDTIYAEGQRRYVESLSAYARQFLSLMEKPDVDSIDGLSPAISIEQKATSRNPRSTVGTVTEIYDYLRLLYARIGNPTCPIHGERIERQSPARIADRILTEHKGKKIDIYAPVIRDKKGTYEQLLKDFFKDGYTKARVDDKTIENDKPPTLERYKKHTIELLIDTLTADAAEAGRIQEAVEASLRLAEGLVIIEGKLYSEKMACPKCGYTFEELQPRLFSFNTPHGACTACAGLGVKQEVDPELVIPDKSLCIAEGAIAAYRNAVDGWRGQILASVAKQHGFDALTPISKLTKRQQDIILYGAKEKVRFKLTSRSSEAAYHWSGEWEGVVPQLERLYHQTESDYRRREIEKFMRVLPCPACKGKRLNEKALAVHINDKNIIQATDLSIVAAATFFENLQLSEQERTIAKQVLKEINARLSFLLNVGLGYLTLSRNAGTLSGGEAQRIRLATQIGSNLTGVLYVLDEPSIGLHQRDNDRLIRTLHKLRDLGNTLMVVEHDEDTIRAADHVVDMGPGAGVHGGKVVAQGTPTDIERNARSLTGQYLSGKQTIAYATQRRKPTGWLTIKGAAHNNLKGIDVKVPKGVLTLVTGVSGSGKSTLVHEILYKALMRQLHGSSSAPGKHRAIVDADFEKVIIIDQSPIGKTPRSNPATYTKLFDEVRALFAMTAEAKIRGYKQGRFSFNVKGGRCEKCQGDGVIKIEMNFLPDVYIECDECKGKRYDRETLEVLYKGKSIADVLDMSVEEALGFFENYHSIRRKVQTLFDVGLGYMKLGQSSTTLSGGESQRIKLTRELSKRSTAKTLYILDEPTTGLHFHDINQLLKVFNRLVDAGSTMIIIEHNLDVIKNADWIVDLGPEGGDEGGRIVVEGTPEDVVKKKESYTGKFLKRMLKH